MLIQMADYNGSDRLVFGPYKARWREIQRTLESMPLHLKASDQEGIRGTPIFDPVGTNSYIRERLIELGWQTNIRIPDEYSFLGTDVDYGKEGVVVEAQFSNYPFLLNNLLRSELFSKSRIGLTGQPTGLTVIVTKAHMFPASNSTLYYEQAVKQLNSLARHGIFEAPIRLIGLFERPDTRVSARWTQYRASRYSRAVAARRDVSCRIELPRTEKGRCRVVLL